jgi:hypothetical protein
VGPFSFCDRTFNDHAIDLSVVVSLLPLIVEVGVRTSHDGENCTVGRKVVSLLRSLTDL